MHSSWFFRIKPIARLISKARNFPEAVQFACVIASGFQCHAPSGRFVTPKSVPPKIGPPDRFLQKSWSPGSILAKKLVPRTDFGSQDWSPLAKNSPPRGTKVGKHIASYACQNRSPMQNCEFIPSACMHIDNVRIMLRSSQLARGPNLPRSN